jgi:integrase
MVRPKAQTPALTYHISGHSVVRIDGRDFYLGTHGSAESLARYAFLIAEYQRNGLSLPDSFDIRPINALVASLAGGSPIDPISTHQADEPILVKHVTAAYREYVAVRHKNSPSETSRSLQICRILDSECPDLEADKFGPRALLKLRSKWVSDGKSRQYCNRTTNSVFRLFKWAVSAELVNVTTHQRLKTVEPLRIGESDAYDTDPVTPANLEHVRKTIPYLPPQLRAVVRIQVATGARPSEILMMTPSEIDRSGEDWVYRPKRHKNANKKKTRSIPLVGDAREAVTDYLNRDPNSYCFSPKEAVEWYNAQKRANRKSKVQPSQRDRRKPDSSKRPRDHYDKHSYRQAIERACKKAGVPYWHPYQLRHLAGTFVRELLGAEAAQALLGHAQPSSKQRLSEMPM